MADLTFTVQYGAKTKTLTVPEAKVPDFQEAFLEAHQIPILRDDAQEIPEFDNALDWFGAYLKRHLFRQYEIGKYKIRQQLSANVDNDVITEA